jgi:two-component system sensor histidine kinase BaeS
VTDLSVAVAEHLDDGVPGMPARVDRDLPPGVLARIDRNALATIVRNLLVNACKYAPGAPQTWRAGTVGGRAFIEVRDQGPGIAAADLPLVFERFYRGEKTRAREEGGSGLGLSIVQGLAQATGGGAAIDSVEGHGAAVTVWFPAALNIAEPPPPPPVPPVPVRG